MSAATEAGSKTRSHMKKIFTILLVSALALVSCKKDPVLTPSSLYGIWHLVSVDGDPVGTKSFSDSEGLDVWMNLQGGSFVLYQKAGSNTAYSQFEGTWSLEGTMISGRYSDGTLWASSYEVILEDDYLTLSSPSEVQLFRKESVLPNLR